MESRAVTLSSIADGAAEEMFAAALVDVLKNLDDPNTDWKAGRKITLEFNFTVFDEDRRAGKVTVKSSTKLSGVKGHQAPVHFGRHHGVLTVVEGPTQEALFTQPDAKPRPVEAVAGGDKL